MALVILSSLLIKSSLFVRADELVRFGRQPNRTHYTGRTEYAGRIEYAGRADYGGRTEYTGRVEHTGRTEDFFLENFYSWREPTTALDYELFTPTPFVSNLGNNLISHLVQPPAYLTSQLKSSNKFTTSDLNLSNHSPSPTDLSPPADFGSPIDFNSSNDPFNYSEDALFTATSALSTIGSPLAENLTSQFANLTGQLIGSTPNLTANLATNLAGNLTRNLTNNLTANSIANLTANLTAELTENLDNRTVDESQSSVNTLYDVPVHLIVLLALAYGLVSLTAVIGNSIVLWFVVRSRKLRTVTNIFIANLAIADILIGALAIPFQFQVGFN